MEKLRKKIAGMGVTVWEQEKEEIRRRVDQIMESGWWMWGDQQTELMGEMEERLGRRHCVTFNSATSAFEVVFEQLVSQGRTRVCFQANQFPSPIFAAVRAGMFPVFCDIELDTLAPSVPELQKQHDAWKFDVLVVQWTGGIVPITADEIVLWCKEHDVYLVEDSSQAMGTSRAGTFGNVAMFSLSSTKALHAGGQGGLLMTDDDELAKIGFQVKTYGRDGMFQSGQFVRLGRNLHMTEMQAAVTMTMLKTMEPRRVERQHLANVYREVLGSLMRELGANASGGAYGPNLYKMPFLLPPGVDRERLRADCLALNVELGSGVYDWWLGDLDPIRMEGFLVERRSLPIGSEFQQRHICMPLHNAMSLGDAVMAAGVIRHCLSLQGV